MLSEISFQSFTFKSLNSTNAFQKHHSRVSRLKSLNSTNDFQKHNCRVSCLSVHSRYWVEDYCLRINKLPLPNEVV